MYPATKLLFAGGEVKLVILLSWLIFFSDLHSGSRIKYSSFPSGVELPLCLAGVLDL